MCWAAAILMLPASALAQGALTEPTLISVAWDAPSTTIDTSYVSAVKALVGNGLSDPRGRVFCRVKASIGLVPFGPPTIYETFGWPQTDGKHAILMDGLEYDVTNVLGPADLDAAVMKMTAESTSLDLMFAPSWHSEATPALLLLVDRSDLAERLSAIEPGMKQGSSAYALCREIYRQSQYLFAKSLVLRRDTEATDWAAAMLKVAMVRKRENIEAPPGVTDSIMPSMEVTSSLYSDVARRALHPKKEPAELLGIDKLTPGKRLDLLIESLDTIYGRQGNVDDVLNFRRHPVYKALLAEGRAIIPDLIEELVFEKRYLRSVTYHFATNHVATVDGFHPVTEVVRALIHDLWPESDKWIDKDDSTMAESLRKAWHP